jgi:hypothetical protein
MGPLTWLGPWPVPVEGLKNLASREPTARKVAEVVADRPVGWPADLHPDADHRNEVENDIQQEGPAIFANPANCDPKFLGCKWGEYNAEESFQAEIS